jgi:mono/diheme cytochrome c family protein
MRALVMRLASLMAVVLGATIATLQGAGQVPTQSQGTDTKTGAQLYREACAACHGADGSGQERSVLGFEVPPPDFTDCSFATREPDADWVAIAHQGGPVRGFSPLMPAFGDALTEDELFRIMGHIRTMCANDAWPRGELNLPRTFFTEKAYPEDEAVLTTGVALTGSASIANALVYEKRFGARNQIELKLPIEAARGANNAWAGGAGDIAIGLKRAVAHNLDRGRIFALTGELILPTGDEAAGLSKGTTIFEPFVSFGQILRADSFVQAQAGVELPFTSRAEREVFWRVAAGRTFTEGPWGRAWSPMLELLAARELVSGERVHWDVVPQVQFTLNTRQHVMANVGVRVPVNARSGRQTQLLVYVLWDWFDGGIADGW